MATTVDQIAGEILALYKRWTPETPLAQRRADWDALFAVEAAVKRLDIFDIDGLRAAWIQPEGQAREGVLLVLHGGGFQVGSLETHADLAARVADACGRPALLVDYRLLPEHPFPAALDDACAAFRYLEGAGHAASSVAMLGDSAGANLAIATVLRRQMAGEAMPAALALLSPWTDMAARGKSYETRSAADPIHQRGMMLRMAKAYLAGADPASPLASPLLADIRAFPATLVQVGDRETILDDARDFAAKLDDAGCDVRCEVWPGMIHVFQQFPDRLPEARKAIASIGEFLGNRLDGRAR